jgi:hypothetical protein
LLGTTMMSRRIPLWFLYAWLFGVLAPHAISATKTPSATLIAMPAGFLLLAHLIAEGWRGQLRPLATWSAILTISAIRPSTIGKFGRGYPDPPVFGGVMLGATWVLEQLALALAVVGVIELMGWWKSRAKSSTINGPWTPGKQALRALALVATLIVGLRVATASWAVTEGSEARPFVTEMADAVRDRLPKNAVLLFDGSYRGEHQLAMFLLDRTCYQLRGRPVDEVARLVRDSGGAPFVVTGAAVPWARRFAGSRDPRGLYEWQAPASAIANEPGNSQTR